MKHKKLPFKEFVAIYKKVPRVAVELVIRSSDSFGSPFKVLLTKRLIPPYKGMWHIPGGSILFKESIPEAIKRIGKEELGLTVEEAGLIGVQEYFRDNGRHTVSLMYWTSVIGGKPEGSFQGSSPKFFQELPNNMIKSQKKFLIDMGVI